MVLFTPGNRIDDRLVRSFDHGALVHRAASERPGLAERRALLLVDQVGDQPVHGTAGVGIVDVSGDLRLSARCTLPGETMRVETAGSRIFAATGGVLYELEADASPAATDRIP